MAEGRGIDNIREVMAKGRAARADALNSGRLSGSPEGGGAEAGASPAAAGAEWRLPSWLPEPGEGAPSTPSASGEEAPDIAAPNPTAPGVGRLRRRRAPWEGTLSSRQAAWEGTKKGIVRLRDTFWSKEEMRLSLLTSGGIAAARLGLGLVTGGLSEVETAVAGAAIGAGRAGLIETRRVYKKQREELEGRADLTPEEQVRLDKLRGNVLEKFRGLQDKRKIAGKMVTAGALGALGGELGLKLKEWGVAGIIAEFAGEHIKAVAGSAAGTAIGLSKRFWDSRHGGDRFLSKKTAINAVVGGLIGATLGTGLEILGPQAAGLMGSGVKPEALPTTVLPPGYATVGPEATVPPRPTLAGPVESPVPAPKPADAVPSPKPSPSPSPERPGRIPTPGKIIPPRPEASLLNGGYVYPSQSDVSLISHEQLLVPNNLVDFQPAVTKSAVDMLQDGFTGDSIRMRPEIWSQIEPSVKDGGSFLYSQEGNDALNLPPTQDLVLTEPDRFSPTSLGPDHQDWSSLTGKVQAWAMDDFYKIQDPALISKMEALIKADNIKFFGDDNLAPGEQSYWERFRAGKILSFDPQNGNDVIIRDTLMKTPEGRELLNKQFIGGYVNAKLNNPEDPANLGSIFNKNNSDYFKHGVPLKIAEPEKLMTDLRKAA